MSSSHPHPRFHIEQLEPEMLKVLQEISSMAVKQNHDRLRYESILEIPLEKNKHLAPLVNLAYNYLSKLNYPVKKDWDLKDAQMEFHYQHGTGFVCHAFTDFAADCNGPLFEECIIFTKVSHAKQDSDVVSPEDFEGQIQLYFSEKYNIDKPDKIIHPQEGRVICLSGDVTQYFQWIENESMNIERHYFIIYIPSARLPKPDKKEE